MHSPLPSILVELLAIIGDGCTFLGHERLEQAVQNALSYDLPELHLWDTTSADGFLDYAQTLLKWIPRENKSGKEMYYNFCVFHFILCQEPLGPMYSKVHPTAAGKQLTPLSQWLVKFANAVGQWLSTPDSLTEETLQSFYEPEGDLSYNLHECIIPPGGFISFNEFFARTLKPGMRPVDAEHDDRVITFPADSAWAGAWDVSADSIVTIKNIPWRITDILEDTPFSNDFANGVWCHSFLAPNDYHRQHAPVSGKLVYTKIVPGAVYLQVSVKEKGDGAAGLEIKGGRQSEFELNVPNDPGYQFLQARGIFIIDNPTIGLVAVIPVGMAQVSSVVPTVTLGQQLTKGQELSYFQFGGSDCVMIFQKPEISGLYREAFPPLPAPGQKSVHYNYGNTVCVSKK